MASRKSNFRLEGPTQFGCGAREALPRSQGIGQQPGGEGAQGSAFLLAQLFEVPQDGIGKIYGRSHDA